LVGKAFGGVLRWVSSWLGPRHQKTPIPSGFCIKDHPKSMPKKKHHSAQEVDFDVFDVYRVGSGSLKFGSN